MEREERIGKIKEFILRNGLEFTDTGSGLNSECCIISGYALHLGTEDVDEISEAIQESIDEPSMYYDELDRVFNFAEGDDYGSWWNSKEAKKQYKF